jgi:c-di-GMP-binding flagellar brake protein YcgR
MTARPQPRAFQDCEARKRRRHYRTSPPSRKSLKAYVGTDRTRCWKGFIEDITSGGARLSFPGEDHPVYALHESVYVQISSPYLERTLVIPSIVSYRYESVERATYGFEFKKRPAELIHLPAPLQPVFNRRRDRRVRPAPEQPIHLTVMTSDGERYETLAQDISTGGLSFVLAAHEGALLAPGDTIEVEIRLPGSRETFRAKAILSSRGQTEGGMRLGASFEAASRDLAPLKEALASYVRDRRREIARGRRTVQGRPA